MDIVQPYSYVPLTFSKFKIEMGFFERLSNALVSFYFAVFFWEFLQFDVVVREALPEAPRVTDVHSKVSFIFLNSDAVLHNSAPNMPHVISIGGLNCRDPKPLPQDLKAIMEESGSNGVIYFSMGTMIQVEMADKDLPQLFLSVFSRLNQTVLWKYPSQLENVPENVKIVKWVPQQDVLGHPNVRLSITQGGIFSIQEAIYHGVPLLGLPIFTDQFNNVVRIEELGLGLHLDAFNLKYDELYATITEILNDPGYKKRAKKYSKIFKDQADSPMERAVFWTEYLINHPEAALHFRRSTNDLNLLQYHSLDVLFSFTTALLILLWSLWKQFRYISSKLRKQ